MSDKLDALSDFGAQVAAGEMTASEATAIVNDCIHHRLSGTVRGNGTLDVQPKVYEPGSPAESFQAIIDCLTQNATYPADIVAAILYAKAGLAAATR